MPIIKIEIPYMITLSKNQSHRNIAINKRVPTKAYTKALKAIAILIKGQMNKSKVSFTEGKVWLNIMIYRPNMRGDPANFIDALCDGVKGALGVDDRYYSVNLDWVLDKDNPRITIEVRQ